MRLTLVLVFLCVLSTAASAAAPPPSPRLKAIGKGLAFLAGQQQKSGLWQGTGGRYSVGITGIVLLAYLSDGHAPGKGPYGKVIEDAVRAVLAKQQATGVIAGPGSAIMYEHGIATFMLAQVHEVAAGPLKKEVRKALDRAVALIVKTQGTAGRHQGGWRYSPRQEFSGDMSITGWQVLALSAAKAAGCEVPKETFERAAAFTLRCLDLQSGGFRYMPYSRPTVSCTASGVLVLTLAGKATANRDELTRARTYMHRTNVAWQMSYFLDGAFKSALAADKGDPLARAALARVEADLLARQDAAGGWGSSTSTRTVGPPYGAAMAVLTLTAREGRMKLGERRVEPEK